MPQPQDQAFATQGITWSYLFLHHTRVVRAATLLSSRFPTYVHKTARYLRTRKRVVSVERETVSGLLFVQGSPTDIATYLHEYLPGHYLARDCATGRVAIIPDSQMQPFMRITDLDSQRLRFLPHGLDYYAQGHPRVRILGGPLNGLEGYILRIARDRRLVLSVGSFTLALGGIHKEQFENIDQYVADRRTVSPPASAVTDTPLQAEIRSTLLRPATVLDHLAVARVMSSWQADALATVGDNSLDESLRILLSLLHVVGSLYRPVFDSPTPQVDWDEVRRQSTDVCCQIETLMNHPDLYPCLRTDAETAYAALQLQYPFLFGDS